MSGTESASGWDKPSDDPGLEQPVSEPVDEAAPESGKLVERLDPLVAGSEAVGGSSGQAGESGPPSVRTEAIEEALGPSGVPATEVLTVPTPVTIPDSAVEEAPVASKLDTMAAGASNFSKVSVSLFFLS